MTESHAILLIKRRCRDPQEDGCPSWRPAVIFSFKDASVDKESECQLVHNFLYIASALVEYLR